MTSTLVGWRHQSRDCWCWSCDDPLASGARGSFATHTVGKSHSVALEFTKQTFYINSNYVCVWATSHRCAERRKTTYLFVPRGAPARISWLWVTGCWDVATGQCRCRVNWWSLSGALLRPWCCCYCCWWLYFAKETLLFFSNAPYRICSHCSAWWRQSQRTYVVISPAELRTRAPMLMRSRQSGMTIISWSSASL